jgi:hypothetical protein
MKLRNPMALVALAPQAAAAASVPTGITGSGASVFIFVIAAAILVLLVGGAAARPFTRKLGERAARYRISRKLARRSKFVMNNARLPGAYGGIAKLDHVVLTPAALLCIYSVHAHGLLAGGENEPQWTLIEGSTKRRFLNPLIHNEGRASALRKAVPEVPVASLVVVSGKVRVTSQPPPNVISLRQLDDRLTQQLLGPARIKDSNAVWQQLQSTVINDAESRKGFAALVGFT